MYLKVFKMTTICVAFISLSSCFDNKKPAPTTLTFEEQLQLDIEIIDDYLAENSILAQKHESGIRYVIKEEGEGRNPNNNSNITFNYIGSFLDGKIFDQSNDPVKFNLSQLIEAFKIGLPLVKEGSTVVLYAPSGYCYGSTGTATIPPNSNLIFEVELITVDEQ